MSRVRNQELIGGPLGCRVLLPYTFSWASDIDHAEPVELDFLDGITDRTEHLLTRARDSPGAAVAEQRTVLDNRLNRVAAVLTVVAAGSFVVDLAEFSRGTLRFNNYARGLFAAVVLLGIIGLVIAIFRALRSHP